MRRFILIPHLKIHNANAMSSPYTIGFPAMTAWLGAVHALQRHLQHNGFADLLFNKVAVSCHKFNLQTYKGDNDFVYSIIGTSNPLDKDGSRPAFIEEARCHLTVSLLIEHNVPGRDLENVQNLINEFLPQMKIASGDLLSVRPAETLTLEEDSYTDLSKITNRLMLGHVLKERRDLMIESMNNGKDALTALFDYLKIMYRAELKPSDNKKDDQKNEVIWSSKRKEAGWLVPIAVGFQGISELGKALNQRDENTPHRFAESIITLGEFIMPYRIDNIDEVLWEYIADQENNLYLCRNQELPVV